MINKVVHVQSEDGQCPDGAERLNQLQHVYRNSGLGQRWSRDEGDQSSF